MSLPSEALVAVTGLFPDAPLGPKDGKAAAALPKEWKAAVDEFLDQKRPARFKRPPKADHAKTWEKLAAGIDPDEIATATAALASDQLTGEYQVTLSNAREYLKARWPVLTLDSIPEPTLLPPGQVEMGRAETLLEALNNPTVILDDMRSNALTYPQADALRSVYPNLFAMLKAQVWEGMQARRAKDPKYAAPWRVQIILRKLIGQPPGVDLGAVKPPPANASKPAPIKVDFSKQQTKAQAIEARDTAG